MKIYEMLKNMEFGVTQNRFEPSLSDSQTEVFIHGQRNLSVIPLNLYTAPSTYTPPSTYIPFSILLISVMIYNRVECSYLL